MSVPYLPVGKAVLAMLEAGTGKRCGLGRLPVGTSGPVPPPYMILTPITRTEDGAPLGNASDWTVQVWQVTSVGGDRMDQAIWMKDKAHGVMIDQTPTAAYVHALAVAGYKVLSRALDTDLGPDEVSGIVQSTSRYAITLTGA